jgi:hypothetical protein
MAPKFFPALNLTQSLRQIFHVTQNLTTTPDTVPVFFSLKVYDFFLNKGSWRTWAGQSTYLMCH